MRPTIKFCVMFGIVLLLCSCEPAVKFSPTHISRPPKADDAHIIVYEAPDAVPPYAISFGEIRVDDIGLTTNCGYDYVVECAIQKARRIGADAIKIILVEYPEIPHTECYKITAKALYFEETQEERIASLIEYWDLSELAKIHFNPDEPQGKTGIISVKKLPFKSGIPTRMVFHLEHNMPEDFKRIHLPNEKQVEQKVNQVVRELFEACGFKIVRDKENEFEVSIVIEANADPTIKNLGIGTYYTAVSVDGSIHITTAETKRSVNFHSSAGAQYPILIRKPKDGSPAPMISSPSGYIIRSFKGRFTQVCYSTIYSIWGVEPIVNALCYYVEKDHVNTQRIIVKMLKGLGWSPQSAAEEAYWEKAVMRIDEAY